MTRRRTGLRAPTSACGGKRRYGSHDAAEQALTALMTAGSHGPSLNAYRCPRCAHWHVGHRPGSRRRR